MAQHNYLTKLLQAVRRGRLSLRPGVHHLDVYHDDWCAVFQGEACDCDPDLKVREDKSGGKQKA